MRQSRLSWLFRSSLLRFVFKRLMLAVLTVFTMATITFFLTRAAPGDPFVQSKEIPAETRRNLEVKYGMDKPLYVQYAKTMTQIFIHFNFGESFRTVGRDVNDIIRERFPVSAKLGLLSVLFGTGTGLILGVLAALYRNTAIDRGAMFLCVMGMALPGFLFAFIFQYFFAVLPTTKLGFDPNIWLRPAGWGELRDYILPCLSLSLSSVAYITRITRTQMVEVQFSEYVKTAKAKGVTTWRLLIFHEVRNAAMPVITILGPLVVYTMMGGLITENIYGIPGLGRAFLNAILNNDYNVLLGLVVFSGTFLVLVFILTDIIYGLVDPRVRVSS